MISRIDRRQKMGRAKGGFATRKRKVLYKHESEAQKQRWTQCHSDHRYSKTGKEYHQVHQTYVSHGSSKFDPILKQCVHTNFILDLP